MAAQDAHDECSGGLSPAQGEIAHREAGNLKKGDLVMIEQRPCKVVSTELSQPGKHGHRKVRIVGKGVFAVTKRAETMMPAHTVVETPVLVKTDAVVQAATTDGEGHTLVSCVGDVGRRTWTALPCVTLAVGEDVLKRVQDGGGATVVQVVSFGALQAVVSCRAARNPREVTDLDGTAAAAEATAAASVGSGPLSKKAQRKLKKEAKKPQKSKAAKAADAA